MVLDSLGVRVPELQIDQDLRFQWRDWNAQRVVIVLMVAFVVVGAVGLLGPGPLSHAHAESADESVALDYLRWARRGRDADLSLQIDPALVRDGEVRVEIPTDYFQDMELRGTSPPPERVEAAGDSLVFVFAAPRPEGRIRIEFEVRGQGMGPLEGAVRVFDTTVRFRQFLWP